MRLNDSNVANDPSGQLHGVGSQLVDMRRHRFASLNVAGLTIAAPQVNVAPIQMRLVVDMLLGQDWLEGRRIWISYATQQLFVAAP